MRRLARAFASAALLALATGLPATASMVEETLEPMDVELAAGQSTEYALSRCAGFHFALITWAGPERLGLAMVNASKQNIFALIQAASTIRAADGDEQATANVVVNVNAFSVKYLNHFAQVAPVLGGPLDKDPMWNTDRDICATFIRQVQ